jgi:hypothetical protein
LIHPLLTAPRGVYHRDGPHKETVMDDKDLPPAARRALAEAEARRKAAEKDRPLQTELGGRDGPEPVRYGDWEKTGLAVDF